MRSILSTREGGLVAGKSRRDILATFASYHLAYPMRPLRKV
jgi:hypothetical protein